MNEDLMGNTGRPVLAHMSQHDQSEHIIDTGNGATVEDEHGLIAAEFGESCLCEEDGCCD